MGAGVDGMRAVAAVAGLALACGMAFAGPARGAGQDDGPLVGLDPPAGWGCSGDSMVAGGEEVIPMVTCLPHEGGSPLSFRRMARSETPVSLEGFLAAGQARAAALEDASAALVAPRGIELGGHAAVEAAFAHQGILHGTDGSAVDARMVLHTLVSQLGGAFFQCQLDASPGLYNAELREALFQFCSSARTAPAPASTGHS